jgi:hypothetical protein
MSDNEVPRRIIECKPEGRRSAGRPGLRWKAGVEDDLRKLNIKNWWTGIVEEDSKGSRGSQRAVELMMILYLTFL